MGSEAVTSTSKDGVTYNRLKGIAATTYNELAKLKLEDSMLALTVSVSDSKYEFTNNSKYLTTTGNNQLTLEDSSSDNSKFTVTTTADGASTFYVSGTAAQIEYSNSNWTTYGTSKTDSAYEIMFYKAASTSGGE